MSLYTLAGIFLVCMSVANFVYILVDVFRNVDINSDISIEIANYFASLDESKRIFYNNLMTWQGILFGSGVILLAAAPTLGVFFL